MKELNFLAKSTNKGAQCNILCDCAVSLQGRNYTTGAYDGFGFSFSKRAELILGKPDAIQIAIDGARMYFKSCDTASGYIVSRKTSKNRVYVKYPARGVKGITRWVGEYNLAFDGEYNLFYIEMKKEGKA